jgi:hypothetical protein
LTSLKKNTIDAPRAVISQVKSPANSASNKGEKLFNAFKIPPPINLEYLEGVVFVTQKIKSKEHITIYLAPT